jgi:hypothetical protein
MSVSGPRQTIRTPYQCQGATVSTRARLARAGGDLIDGPRRPRTTQTHTGDPTGPAAPRAFRGPRLGPGLGLGDVGHEDLEATR